MSMRPTTPLITVDILIELTDRANTPIVLIERKYPPFGWALPGGFVDVGESLVHQLLYIDGSAALWHFASRHSSRAMVVPLVRAVTPRWNATGSPEGLLCLLPWLRCASYEGNNHSLRSRPYHENRQNN